MIVVIVQNGLVKLRTYRFAVMCMTMFVEKSCVFIILGATQRYGDDDDATPELTPEEQEETPSTAVPTVVVSPSKSPLKSALASPKKSSSPSPKRVKFVSQVCVKP